MKLLITLMLVLLPLSASAKRLDCSTRPRDITPATLPGLAKISPADAKTNAIAGIKAPAKSTVEGGLAVEKGCLVYSFEVVVPGKLGKEEVLVDAGNGTILSHKHIVTKKEAEGKAEGEN